MNAKLENGLTSGKFASRSERRQFKATEFWNEAVRSVKTNVESKRKRVKFKTYANCFSGSEVVDAAHQFLMFNKENLACKEASRPQALKLCELMLKSHVFEPVLHKSQKEGELDELPSDSFRDSNNKLYRFLEDLAMENEFTQDTPPNDVSCRNELEFSQTDRSLQNEKQISIRSRPVSCKLSLNDAVDDEIWREVVLAHLLTLVDIPVLEFILSYEHTANKQSANALTYTNAAISRYACLDTLTSQTAADPWLDAALDCLELLPNGIERLHESCTKASQATHRGKIYTYIVEHYSSLAHPLWSNNFSDLHVALLNLLLQGKNDVVLKAMQLSMILLPSSLRVEITRLLLFMKLSANDGDLQIDSTESNRTRTEKSLVQAVIRSKKLSVHQCTLLVMFMVDRAELVDKCPEDTEEKITYRLQLRSMGQDAHLPDGHGYCTRISSVDYAEQQRSATEAALVDLINTIIDDTSIRLKEKKLRLQQMRHSHGQIFEKHFSNLLE